MDAWYRTSDDEVPASAREDLTGHRPTCADLPGGCWVHFSVVDVSGHRTLQPGLAVVVDWEERDQDGLTYAATRVSLPPPASQ